MDAQEILLERLPVGIKKAFGAFCRKHETTELHLRSGAPLCAVTWEGNFFLGKDGAASSPDQALCCTEEDLTETVSALCEGCSYRYFDTLAQGFLIHESGIRIGIAGERRGDLVRLPEHLVAINLRLPRSVPRAADPFLRLMEQRPLGSTLILSPPGGGKTTFLRALAGSLTRGSPKRAPLRVAVIDERRELFPAAFRGEGACCDILSGLPKAQGIGRAVRLFSPQALICDEIGGQEEANAILGVGNGGVLFFASCHAETREDALGRPGIRSLVEAGLFRYFLSLRPKKGQHFQADLILEDVC